MPPTCADPHALGGRFAPCDCLHALHHVFLHVAIVLGHAQIISARRLDGSGDSPSAPPQGKRLQPLPWRAGTSRPAHPGRTPLRPPSLKTAESGGRHWAVIGLGYGEGRDDEIRGGGLTIDKLRCLRKLTNSPNCKAARGGQLKGPAGQAVRLLQGQPHLVPAIVLHGQLGAVGWWEVDEGGVGSDPVLVSQLLVLIGVDSGNDGLRCRRVRVRGGHRGRLAGFPSNATGRAEAP